jgi:hypothetical protein
MYVPLFPQNFAVINTLRLTQELTSGCGQKMAPYRSPFQVFMFVFLALQPTVGVFSQAGSGL